MANHLKDALGKKKKNQRNQGGAGSTSIQSGNPNIYRGVGIPPTQEKVTDTFVGLGKQLGRTDPGQGSSAPVPSFGPAEAAKYTSSLDPQSEDALSGFPGATDPNYEAKKAAFVASRGGPSVQNEFGGGRPTTTPHTPSPGEFTSRQAGTDVFGRIMETTPLNTEDVNRLGTKVYSRIEDVGTSDVAGSTVVPGGLREGERNLIAQADTRAATAQTGSRGIGGQSGGFDNTAVQKRLNDQRHALRRNKGNMSERLYQKALADIDKTAFGYDKLASETAASARAGSSSADAASIAARTNLAKHGTLSADKAAQLDLDKQKFLIENESKVRELGTKLGLSEKDLGTQYTELLKQYAGDSVQALAALRSFMENQPELLSQRIRQSLANPSTIAEEEANRESTGIFRRNVGSAQ